MTLQDQEKQTAAERAVQEVKDGMRIGLGTGSTAKFAIEALAERVKQGLRITAVASSIASQALADQWGIPTVPGEEVARLDLAIDGADEITRQRLAIKGGGGALLREKVVAIAADKMIVVVDSSKVVTNLGAFPLALEVLPFASSLVRECVARLGANVQQRQKDGRPFRTDQDNYIFDADFQQIDDPAGLAKQLAQIPGLLEHGLFLDEIDMLIIGQGDDTRIIE